MCRVSRLGRGAIGDGAAWDGQAWTRPYWWLVVSHLDHRMLRARVPDELAVAGGVALFVWGIVGTIFKRVTHHRGMAHSIPAAVLAGLATFFAASHFYFSDQDAFLLGVAVLAGYVVHLILDEIYAGVNFHGK